MITALNIRLIKLSIALILFTLIFLATQSAFAEEASNGAVPPKRTIAQQSIETRQQTREAQIVALRERIASREATLKARLEAFRDKRKAEIVARVNTNLANVNQTWTSRMLKHLTKLSEILDKLEARVNRNTADIKDPEATKVAIASARTSIASASAAVSEQALKDYTIQVSTETKVRADVLAKRQALYTDLLAVKKTVIDARKAVEVAVRIAKVGGFSALVGPKEATASGNQ